jgi:hypothetical protein
VNVGALYPPEAAPEQPQPVLRIEPDELVPDDAGLVSPPRRADNLHQCEDDRMTSGAWSDWAAIAITGRPPVLPGGHSPFCTLPVELADLLDEFAVRVRAGAARSVA